MLLSQLVVSPSHICLEVRRDLHYLLNEAGFLLVPDEDVVAKIYDAHFGETMARIPLQAVGDKSLVYAIVVL